MRLQLSRLSCWLVLTISLAHRRAMAAIAGKPASPAAQRIAEILRVGQAVQAAQADQADQDDQQADYTTDLKKLADENDQLEAAQADTMRPADWLKFFRQVGQADLPELAARIATACRVSLTKNKQTEKHLYWQERRQERLASLPSDCSRRWLQHKAAIAELTKEGNHVALAAERAAWADMCRDFSWGAWQGGCLTGLYRQAWVFWHKA